MRGKWIEQSMINRRTGEKEREEGEREREEMREEEGEGGGLKEVRGGGRGGYWGEEEEKDS